MTDHSGIELNIIATDSSDHGSDKSNNYQTGTTNNDGEVVSSTNSVEGIDTNGPAEDSPPLILNRLSTYSSIPENQLVDYGISSDSDVPSSKSGLSLLFSGY